MIILIRTTPAHPEFIRLVHDLDQTLRLLDGKDHVIYAPLNKTQTIKHAVLAMEGEEALACGAFKHYTRELAEIKRMFVVPSKRRVGLAERILNELEAWAKELGHTATILETGRNNPAAIQLYLKSGYEEIANYGPYENLETSICMKKKL